MSQAAPGAGQAVPLEFSLRDDRSPVGSRPQARGEGAPLPSVPAPGPGPVPATHSLLAGARVWTGLPTPLSCVPRGSEGRGPPRSPGSFDRLRAENRKYRVGEKAGPASFRLCQSAAGMDRLFHQRTASPRRRGRSCLAFLAHIPRPRVRNLGCKPQSGGSVYKVGGLRKETICLRRLSLVDPALRKPHHCGLRIGN